MVIIDSNFISRITAAEKLLTGANGAVKAGPTAVAQHHVGQPLTAAIISEITESENAISNNADKPVQGGPTSIAQSAFEKDSQPVSATNTTSSKGNMTGGSSGTLNSDVIHEITEREKDLTGEGGPVKGGPTAKAQQHAGEGINSATLHDITEGEKKVTGGERVKGGPTSAAQSELGKSRQ